MNTPILLTRLQQFSDRLARAPRSLQGLCTLLGLAVISGFSPAWPVFNHLLTPYLNIPMLERFSEASLLEVFRFAFVLSNHPTLLEQVHGMALWTLIGHLAYMSLMVFALRMLLKRLKSPSVVGV
jgi:hypothetical protein